jgi:hypothetical protein
MPRDVVADRTDPISPKTAAQRSARKHHGLACPEKPEKLAIDRRDRCGISGGRAVLSELVVSALFLMGFAGVPASVSGQQSKVPACMPETLDANSERELRRRFERSDRMRTAAAERLIQDSAKRCLQQMASPDKATVRATEEQIRAFFVRYGYRPSKAAPAPDFYYCRIHYDYSPPRYSDYYDIYFYSDVVADPAPDNYADREKEITVRERQTATRMREWIAKQRYRIGTEPIGEPTYTDEPSCSHFATGGETSRMLESDIEDIGKEAQRTGVQ